MRNKSVNKIFLKTKGGKNFAQAASAIWQMKFCRCGMENLFAAMMLLY